MKVRVSLMFKSECLKKNMGEGAAGWRERNGREGKVMRAKWSRDKRGGSLSQESVEVSGGSNGGGGEMKRGRRKSGAFMHKLTGSSPETTNNGSMG